MTTVVFVEPVGNYTPLIEGLNSSGSLGGAAVFLPSSGHIVRMMARASEIGVTLDNKFWPFSTVNLNYDDHLYNYAMEVSEAFFAIVRSCARAAFGASDILSDERLRWATMVTFHDRFVAQLRPYLEFRNQLAQNGARKVIFAPRPTAAWRVAYKVIQDIAGDVPVEVWTDHWHPRQRDLFLKATAEAKATSKYIVPSQETILPLFDFIKMSPAKGLLLSVNLRDKQYKFTILPILAGLLREFPVSCLNYAKIDDDNFADDFGLGADLSYGQLSVYQKESPPGRRELKAIERTFISNIGRRSEVMIERRQDDFSLFSEVIANYIVTYSYPVLQYIARMTRELDVVIASAKCVIVLPGRSLEANILVACAKARGIPTVEIQSGTISPTRRFIRPLADEVLAIDPFSKSVYCEFLGKKEHAVHITGGPKLDYDLSSVRNLSCETARKEIGVSDVVAKDKLAMLASQPIGITNAAKVAEIAITAVNAQQSTWLLIKPHPNENSEYVAAYRRIAVEQKFDRLIVLEDVDVLKSVVAADVVLTYYSTVGLEAFCLGKTTLCINPFGSRPPFDLVKLGVAAEITDAACLERNLNRVFFEGVDLVEFDPLLNNMRDGGAIERAQNHILMRAKEYSESQKVINHITIWVKGHLGNIRMTLIRKWRKMI